MKIGDCVAWEADNDPEDYFEGILTGIDEENEFATVKCQCGAEYCEIYLDQLVVINDTLEMVPKEALVWMIEVYQAWRPDDSYKPLRSRKPHKSC